MEEKISKFANYLKLLKELLDYYHNKFPDLDTDILADIIEEAIVTTPIEFTYDYIQSKDYCIRCGNCCSSMECEHLQHDEDNYKLYVCDIWKDRWRECRDWPYIDIMNGRGIYLSPECDYIRRLIYEVLDRRLELYVGDVSDSWSDISKTKR
jgi:hypothetical protein